MRPVYRIGVGIYGTAGLACAAFGGAANFDWAIACGSTLFGFALGIAAGWVILKRDATIRALGVIAKTKLGGVGK